ncbi:hypothetical protein ONE63_007176 [Megalurothrips usitatus]|uniref:Major facilitator superfamily (MFS) profile domain-containing protein n=1 Tax=Megalurothrips usitatus TaxID=439358 RepID=A0AAV7XR79_9NEOP|nr:hypothetical protein ONE63_007176 [Megalurothrips usitatus]
MTAVCCSGRCLGCCAWCGSRRSLARRAQCRAVLPVLLVLLGAGYGAALSGAWLGWTLLGAALCGGLQDVLGRRSVIALSVPLQVAAVLVHAWLVQEPEEAVLDGVALGVRLVRSACSGVALGLALPAALFYLAELWRGARRGAVCCVPAIAVLAGRTLAYGLEEAVRAADAPPRVATLAGLAPGCLGLLLLLLLAPPSPFWLALRGREVALASSIARIRGLRDERGARDEAEDVAYTVREQRASLCAGNWRGPLLSLLLVGGMPLAGVPLLEAHLPAVLSPFGEDVADGGRWAWLVRVSFGGALVLAVAVVALLTDRCGRRPLVAAACLVLAAGHATLGYFHWFLGTPLPPRATLAWYITLGALSVAAVAGAALSALAWLVIAEVLPVRAKAVVPSLALLLALVLQSSLDALHEALPVALLWAEDEDSPLERRWPAAWCWAHSLWCLLLALVVAVLLPETKGFSLAQLHEIFRGPNRQNMRTRL